MSIRRAQKSSIAVAGKKGSSVIAGYGPGVDEMDLIQRVTVGAGGQAALDFTSIPQTYQHLQIRLIARTARTGPGEDALGVRLNSDSGATKYAFHVLLGNGSSASASSAASTNLMVGVNAASNSATANAFGCAVIDILDYGSTSKTKIMRSLTGFETNTEGKVEVRSGLWNDTTAVTGITIASTISSNLLQFSSASLYGVVA